MIDIVKAANAQLSIWEDQLMNSAGDYESLVETRGKIKGLREFTQNVIAAVQQGNETKDEQSEEQHNSVPEAEAGDAGKPATKKKASAKRGRAKA